MLSLFNYDEFIHQSLMNILMKSWKRLVQS